VLLGVGRVSRSIILGVGLVLTTLAMLVSELIGGHPMGAVFYGIVMVGGTYQWWRRCDVDDLAWTFLTLALGIAAMRWDANMAAWLGHG
jgi:hypothetical protein